MTITADDVFLGERTDPALEAALFGRLKMRNGTFKRTAPRRFVEVEEALAPAIAARADSVREVLDIGVSTGITTLELADWLADTGAAARITATDLFIGAHVVTLAPGVTALVDAGGFPLEYAVAGRPVRAWVRRLDYATGAAVPRLLARRWAGRRAARLIADGDSRPLKMVSPRLLARPDIDVLDDDITATNPRFARRFDLVRAANVLNRTTLSEAALAEALRNVRRYVRGLGALLLITRTGEAGDNAATLFELGTRGFTVIERVGSGSEIEDLVIGLPEDVTPG